MTIHSQCFSVLLTGGGAIMNEQHPDDDVLAAFALGILDEDSAAVVRHLEDCPGCRGQVAEIERTADRVAAAVAPPRSSGGARVPDSGGTAGFFPAVLGAGASGSPGRSLAGPFRRDEFLAVVGFVPGPGRLFRGRAHRRRRGPERFGHPSDRSGRRSSRAGRPGSGGLGPLPGLAGRRAAVDQRGHLCRRRLGARHRGGHLPRRPGTRRSFCLSRDEGEVYRSQGWLLRGSL